MSIEIPLRLAVVGCGLAGKLVTRSLATDPRVELMVGVDPDPAARQWFEKTTGGTSVESVQQLPAYALDVAWITTPTRLHRQHVLVAAGLHLDIVVEKPMAVTVADCDVMIAAAAENGVRLIAGGVRSLDPAFQTMHAVIASGRIGSLRTVQGAAWTSWLTRSRSKSDLDEAHGGGMLYNQTPHQLDVVRTLASGARVISVRARAGDWSTAQPGTGYYSADVELEGGVFATLTYDGYGRIDPTAFAPHDQCGRCSSQAPWVPTDAGLIVAVCDEGELPQVAHGVEISSPVGTEWLAVPAGDANTGVVDRLLDVTLTSHDGNWGRDTQAAVVAFVRSARSGHRTSPTY